jgi:hypothetical protein
MSIKKINYLKKKQIDIINNICDLYKLLAKLKDCKIIHECKCAHYICKYNTKYQNELEHNIINKKQFRNRHQKYIYKITKTIDCYYKELKSIEKQCVKIHTINMDTQIIDTPFYELLLLGKELFNEQVC